MALIKKSQIQESGEVYLEKKQVKTEPAAEMGDRFLGEEERKQRDNDHQIEAESIIGQARREADEIKNNARKEGLGEGRSTGREEIKNKIKEALQTLNEAVKERKKIIKDAEAEVLRLALKAAEQIIRSEVSLHRDVCLNIVSEAINRVSDREQIIIKVNREDADYIKRYKDRLSGIIDGVKSFSVLEDNSIEPGGCIIETNLGYIDARIATKLESIEEAFGKMND
ncbi:FliH/SctL family protein [Candidatus Margulisiibacteriota bacterium]